MNDKQSYLKQIEKYYTHTLKSFEVINILIAIKLNERKDLIFVNEIKSIYGKTNLKEYLLKHATLNQLQVVDNKKAEMLSRVIGLQLPKTLIVSSYSRNVPSINQKVNIKISIRNAEENVRNG